MNETITTQQAAAFLTAHDGYLILTHMRPDGDTVGCAAGLCRALRQAGKTAYVLENEGASSLFTPYFEGLTPPEGFTPEAVVSVDMASRGLFPDNAKPYLDRVDLAVARNFSPRPPAWTAPRRPAARSSMRSSGSSPRSPRTLARCSMWPSPPTAAVFSTATPTRTPTGWPRT